MNIQSKHVLLVAVMWVVFQFPAASVAQEHANQTDLPLSAATRTQVIEAVLKRLNDSYVSPETAARLEQSIRARMEKGEYNQINRSAVLAQTLTEHLAEVAKDKHLGVSYSHEAIPLTSNLNEPSSEDRERFRRMASSVNFGFEKVERFEREHRLYGTERIHQFRTRC